MSINQKTRLRPELDPLKQLGNIVLLERPLNAETLASAADALAMMRENPTGLRKCDIGMPYMNCFDLIRQVRQLYGRQARASGHCLDGVCASAGQAIGFVGRVRRPCRRADFPH